MEQRPEPGSRVPAPRRPVRPPERTPWPRAHPDHPRSWPPALPQGQPPPDRDPFRRRRLLGSPRGAAGVAVLAAALLLWPFAAWSPIPWLVGLVLLVVLHLLRLDGPLRGWAPHVAGLAVVAGLMYSTSPWAWALAASIGVLLAGLAMLPRWKVAAVGAALCAVAGTGFGIAQYRTHQELEAQQAQAQLQSQGQEGAARPQGVLPVLLNRIAENVPGPVCDNLLDDQSKAAFAAAAGQADCPTAVAAIAGQVIDRGAYAQARARFTALPDGLAVNACTLSWPSGTAAGPQLGRLVIGRKPGGSTYVVTAFSPC